MNSLLGSLNSVLESPTRESIYSLFEVEGFLRFNMLYVSPIALKHFKTKLLQYNLQKWFFTEVGLVFQLNDQEILFQGSIAVTSAEKIFCVELDFDPVIPDDRGVEFLQDVETFLKKCDSCFFMTYPIYIDREVLANPVSNSLEYLASRKQ